MCNSLNVIIVYIFVYFYFIYFQQIKSISRDKSQIDGSIDESSTSTSLRQPFTRFYSYRV